MLSLHMPIQSWAHKQPVGLKLICLALVSIIIFPITNPIILGLFFTFTALLYISLGTEICVQGARMLRPLMWIVILMLGFHLLMGNLGDGLIFVVKMISLVALANFVTMTSRLDDMMETLLWGMSPLQKIGINTAAIALAFALVIRFTPTLIAKASGLMQAWRARSTRKVSWQIIMPLFWVALDDADNVSSALRARGGTPKS